MGDAGEGALGMVVLDGYERAYALDLARSIGRHTPDRAVLGAALRDTSRQRSAGIGALGVAMTVASDRTDTMLHRLLLGAPEAEQARALAGTVTHALGRRASFAIAVGEGADALAGRLAGAAEPAFLVARDPLPQAGFDSADGCRLGVETTGGRLGDHRHGGARHRAGMGATMAGSAGAAPVAAAKPGSAWRSTARSGRSS